MTWTSGTRQEGYLIARLAGGTVVLLPVQPPSATSYFDQPRQGGLNCYLLLALGTPGVSDLLCVLVGTGAAMGAPQETTLRLNDSQVASLTWRGQLGGGQRAFFVVAFGARTQVLGPLPSSATTATHDTGGAFSCYAVVAQGDLATGNSDVLCGAPGVSTFGGLAGTRR